MRPRRLLLALPLGFFACLSNNASNSDTDGGPDLDASFDSAPPAEDAAPGVDAPADAPVEAAPIAEASVDAPVDSPPPALTIVVGGPQGLESGVPVVWSDSTGAVLGMSTTNAAGSASSTAATVSMATVITGTTSNPYLYTVMGAQLGQTVPVADLSSLAQSPSLTVDVTSVPSTPTLGDGSAVTYFLASGDCQSSDNSTIPDTYNLYSSSDEQPCVGYDVAGSSSAAAFPVLVEADDQEANPVGFAFSKSNSATATPDDAGQLSVALASPWQTTFTTQAIAVTNATSSPIVQYSEVADGVLTPLQQRSTTLADGGPSTVVSTHPGFADDVQVEAAFQAVDQFGATTVIATTSLPPTTSGTVTLDATPVANAPIFQSSAVDSTTSQPVISWTLNSGTLAATTLVIAEMTWNGQNDGGNQNGVWTIVSPGTAASSLTAPALPPSLSAFTPPAGSISDFQTLFAITGQGGLSTYESLLPTASLYQSQSALCGINSPAVAPLPGIGSVVMSAYTNEGGC